MMKSVRCTIALLLVGAAGCGGDSDADPDDATASAETTGTDGTGPSSMSAADSSPSTTDPATTNAPTTDPDGTGTDTSVAGPISIVDVSPPPEDLDADREGDIVITLEGSVDPDSVTPASVMIFARWSGVPTGELSVEDGGSTIRFSPSRPFFAGEWVGVSLTEELRSISGETLAQGYAFGFWTAGSPGTLDLDSAGQRPTRRMGEGWIQSYGAYAGDLNGDGFSDLMIPNEQADDVRILLNDGAGNYPELTVTPIPDGEVPSTNEGGDFNGDGIIDFAVGNAGGSLVSTFLGNGDGTVQHAGNYLVGNSVRGVCLLDVDTDGDVDMVSANRVGDGNGNISILLGDGAGGFVVDRTTNLDTDSETSCASADANGDGLTDVFIGSLQGNEILLLLSDGEGGLTESARVTAGGGPWMLAAGDVNGDGAPDVVSANFSGNSMGVVLGDGEGGLADSVNYPVGNGPLAIDVGDIDGDGDLDAIASNFDSGDFTLYENSGDGTYVEPRTYAAASAGSCAIVHDRDGDGDVDVTAIDELDDIIFYFDNPGS